MKNQENKSPQKEHNNFPGDNPKDREYRSVTHTVEEKNFK